MKIDNSHPLDKKKTESKEKKVPRGQSFHELMATRELPKRIQRRQSIFDVAGNKGERGTRSKKEVKDSAHHGAVECKVTTHNAAEPNGIAEVSELSAEMHELIDKMSNFIQMESQKGIATTTVFVEMEGSVFDGSQIVIAHYDTAPHSFNLQLSGSPEAADLFAANLAALRTSLHTHQALKGFEIELLPPYLTEKSDLYLRGKGKEKKNLKKPLLGKKISF